MPIADSERAFLTETRALSRDDQGRETFVGLTYEETEEYLRLLEDRREDRWTDHMTMLDRLSELSDKHEKMRRAIVIAEAQSRRSGPKH